MSIRLCLTMVLGALLVLSTGCYMQRGHMVEEPVPDSASLA
jgi:hypothetical protein